MTITEMHVWFRQYAQQMGLQNVRAILPEQIDLVINTSITDIINQIITQNIGVTNDRIITDNSKISQINALRTLYKVIESDFKIEDTASSSNVWKNVEETPIRYLEANIKDITNNDSESFEYLFLVDLSIRYYTKVYDSDGVTYKKNSTNYFPVRLIDDCFLADTLNDFILRPRLRSPIAVIVNDKIDVYYKNDSDIQANVLNPHKLRVSYIAKPAKVAYLADVNGTNVDCDLPEYLHVDILKHAVDLYRIAVTGQLHNSQQQAQPQQANAQQQTQ